jgi:hypothetical protein
MNDARLWHPWLRTNRVMRVMLQTRWSAEAWSVVRVEFRNALRAAESDPARGVVQRAAWGALAWGALKKVNSTGLGASCLSSSQT